METELELSCWMQFLQLIVSWLCNEIHVVRVDANMQHPFGSIIQMKNEDKIRVVLSSALPTTNYMSGYGMKSKRFHIPLSLIYTTCKLPLENFLVMI